MHSQSTPIKEETRKRKRCDVPSQELVKDSDLDNSKIKPYNGKFVYFSLLNLIRDRSHIT